MIAANHKRAGLYTVSGHNYNLSLTDRELVIILHALDALRLCVHSPKTLAEIITVYNTIKGVQ